MSLTIKSYLQVFPILWWCALLLIASGAVALFPFDNMAFNYLVKSNVLAVVGKTLGIGCIILCLEFWVGYHIFISGFWKCAPGRAILIHVLGGVTLPAVITIGLILLVYPASIVDDDRFQWDISFMVLLLIILNYWLANRMLRYEVMIIQEARHTLLSEKDSLARQVGFLTTEIAHYKNDAQQLASTTDKTVHGLIEGNNLLTVQIDELRAENNRLIDRIEQLELAINLATQARMRAESSNQHLQSEITGFKASAHPGGGTVIDQNDRSGEVLHFKAKGIEIAIVEEDIVYCYGHHRKGEDSFQEIVLMDGTKYHPGLKSLTDLLKVFPSLRHISRNYLIAGDAIRSYQMQPGNTALLTIAYCEEQIEYGESYRRKYPDWKNWLVRQVATNQKTMGVRQPGSLIVNKDSPQVD